MTRFYVCIYLISLFFQFLAELLYGAIICLIIESNIKYYYLLLFFINIISLLKISRESSLTHIWGESLEESQREVPELGASGKRS